MLNFLSLIVQFLSNLLSIVCDIPIVGELNIGNCVFLIIVVGCVVSIMWGRRGD